MRILHIVAGLAPSGGGLSELVPMFAREAARQGHEVTLVTVAREKDELSGATSEAQAAGVRIVRFEPCRPRFLFFSWKMLSGLGGMVRRAQVVHVHSNWTFPVWWACHCARVYGKPFLMSPQGCLEPVRLRHSAWKKRLAGLFDRHYLRRAAVIHATCEAEAEGIRTYLGPSFAHPCIRADRESKEGGERRAEDRRQRTEDGGRAEWGPEIVVIPNGVDVETFKGVADRAGIDQRFPGCQGARLALFLARLHPLKGADFLLEAWRCVASDYPEWRLVIAGPDEAGHGERLKRQARALGLEGRVTFCGPVYGKEKIGIMQSAALFVLPTLSENFGIAVAEALACGVPVITTKGAPWQELLGSSCHSSLVHYCESAFVEETEDRGRRTEDRRSELARHCESALVGNPEDRGLMKETGSDSTHELTNSRTNELAHTGRCGWWIDIGVEPLAIALREAMNLTEEERRQMGENGRRLAEGKYRWEAVAERLSVVYGEIVKGGE